MVKIVRQHMKGEFLRPGYVEGGPLFIPERVLSLLMVNHSLTARILYSFFKKGGRD